MNHINFFIHQLELNKRAFNRTGKRGSHNGWVRSTALFVVWKFSGLHWKEVAKIFGVSKVAVWSSVKRCSGYLETNDSLFTHHYNEILEFYIKTTKSYLKKNQIYNLKQVA